MASWLRIECFLEIFCFFPDMIGFSPETRLSTPLKFLQLRDTAFRNNKCFIIRKISPLLEIFFLRPPLAGEVSRCHIFLPLVTGIILIIPVVNSVCSFITIVSWRTTEPIQFSSSRNETEDIENNHNTSACWRYILCCCMPTTFHESSWVLLHLRIWQYPCHI